MKFIKNKKLVLCFCVFVFLCFIILSANVCFAADGQISIWKNMEECRKSGSCSLNDFTRLAVNASQWILGIVGSLALLMFIYGGLMMILAGVSTRAEGGKDKRINIGKDAIENAIVGLVIVFISYMIIGFIFKATGADPSQTAWSKTDWFKTNK